MFLIPTFSIPNDHDVIMGTITTRIGDKIDKSK